MVKTTLAFNNKSAWREGEGEQSRYKKSETYKLIYAIGLEINLQIFYDTFYKKLKHFYVDCPFKKCRVASSL